MGIDWLFLLDALNGAEKKPVKSCSKAPNVAGKILAFSLFYFGSCKFCGVEEGGQVIIYRGLRSTLEKTVNFRRCMRFRIFSENYRKRLNKAMYHPFLMNFLESLRYIPHNTQFRFETKLHRVNLIKAYEVILLKDHRIIFIY